MLVALGALSIGIVAYGGAAAASAALVILMALAVGSGRLQPPPRAARLLIAALGWVVALLGLWRGDRWRPSLMVIGVAVLASAALMALAAARPPAQSGHGSNRRPN